MDTITCYPKLLCSVALAFCMSLPTLRPAHANTAAKDAPAFKANKNPRMHLFKLRAKEMRSFLRLVKSNEKLRQHLRQVDNIGNEIDRNEGSLWTQFGIALLAQQTRNHRRMEKMEARSKKNDRKRKKHRSAVVTAEASGGAPYQDASTKIQKLTREAAKVLNAWTNHRIKMHQAIGLAVTTTQGTERGWTRNRDIDFAQAKVYQDVNRFLKSGTTVEEILNAVGKWAESDLSPVSENRRKYGSFLMEIIGYLKGES